MLEKQIGWVQEMHRKWTYIEFNTLNVEDEKLTHFLAN